MSQKLYVSLPIKSLDRAMDFFKGLGFTFKFADEKSACMLIGETSFAMLLVEPFFKTLTKKEVCNTAAYAEGAFGLMCESRAEVDAMVANARAGGGKEAGPPQDHGFMYQSSFEDLDGHHWEVMWMDPKAAQ